MNCANAVDEKASPIHTPTIILVLLAIMDALRRNKTHNPPVSSGFLPCTIGKAWPKVNMARPGIAYMLSSARPPRVPAMLYFFIHHPIFR